MNIIVHIIFIILTLILWKVFSVGGMIAIFVVWAFFHFATKSDGEAPSQEVSVHVSSDDSDDHDTYAFKDDAWEGSFMADADDPLPVASKCEIKYTDSNGKKTRRVVSFNTFDVSLYGGSCLAYCHLRKEIRCFRFDRISSAVDIETGEIISNILQHLLTKFYASSFGALHQLSKREMEIFQIFFFLAKVDDRFLPKEKEAVAAFARANTGKENINKDDVTLLFKARDVPSIQKFRGLLKKLNSDTEGFVETCQVILGKKADIPGIEQAIMAEILVATEKK